MIAVVGGGISGLMVGHALAGAGADVVVLEAGPRPGGVIRSVRVEGRVLELGPQRTRLAAPVRQLVGELGLEDELLVADPLPLYIWADGRLRLVPMGVSAAFRTDLLRWRDRLRILAEPLTRGLQPDETAADFFSRKLGRRTYERMIAPLYGGLYASDPADMPARHALAATLESMGVRRSLLWTAARAARRRDAAPACSFRDGMQTLTDALAARLGDRLRLNSPVRGLDRDGPALRVLLDDDAIAADHVVLACPAGSAATILRGLAPAASQRLDRLRYNPLALVHMVSDADLHGLGYQVARDEEWATRGVTWNHALFDRAGLYTAFLGGSRDPDLPARTDDELEVTAAAEFHEMTGHEARPIHVARAWMPAWDRSWDALDGLALPAGVVVCASWAARPGIVGRIGDARRIVVGLAVLFPGPLPPFSPPPAPPAG